MITVPGSSNRVSRDLMLYVALLAGVNIVAAIMLYFFAEGLITSDGPGSIGIAEPEKLYPDSLKIRDNACNESVLGFFWEDDSPRLSVSC